MKWSLLTELQKLQQVSEVVKQLEDEGLAVTGSSVSDRLGVTDRTGRTYLKKLGQETAQDSPSASITPQAGKSHHTEKIVAQKPVQTVSRGTSAVLTKSRVQTALILPDWQCGAHDSEMIEKSLELAHDLQPDHIVHVGDESDCTAIGRWARGTKDEWADNLQEQIDTARGYFKRFRDACPQAKFDICYSNHLKRFADGISTRLPGFSSLRALTPEALYGLAELDITMRYEPFHIFPDVVAAHGHQYGLTSATQYQKASQVVARSGYSLVAGHTHRPVLNTIAAGHLSKETRFYLNVGCAMDFSAATYVTSSMPEWGFGLGILRHINGVTYPELLMARDRQFYFEGRVY